MSYENVEHIEDLFSIVPKNSSNSQVSKYFNPTYYRPFGATSDIGGGHNVPPLLVMHVPLVLS